MSTRPLVVVREYESVQAFQREAGTMTIGGYELVSTTQQEQSIGCLTILTLGFYGLLFKPKAHIIATYRLKEMGAAGQMMVNAQEAKLETDPSASFCSSCGGLIDRKGTGKCTVCNRLWSMKRCGMCSTFVPRDLASCDICGASLPKTA